MPEELSLRFVDRRHEDKSLQSKGEKVGKTDLPDEIFNVEINSNLLHQVIVSQMANKKTI